MFPNCGAGEDSWESLGLQGDQTNQFSRKSTLNSHWKDWYWSWSSNNLATRCQEPTHWKRPWCWERLRIRGEGGDGGWEGWMTSPTQRTRVWANSWSLACCSPWGGKKSDMTERLNSNHPWISIDLYVWSLSSLVQWKTRCLEFFESTSLPFHLSGHPLRELWICSGPNMTSARISCGTSLSQEQFLYSSTNWLEEIPHEDVVWVEGEVAIH